MVSDSAACRAARSSQLDRRKRARSPRAMADPLAIPSAPSAIFRVPYEADDPATVEGGGGGTWRGFLA